MLRPTHLTSPIFSVDAIALCVAIVTLVLFIEDVQGVEGDSLDALVSQLRDSDSETREAAAKSLRRLGPKAAVAAPALIRALGDRNQAVRCQAAVCLGHIGPQAKAAIPSLSRLLKNKDEPTIVRLWASVALGLIGVDALDALVEALQPGQDPYTRRKAAGAIGKIGPRAHTATPLLISVLAEEEYSIWHNASDSLIAIGPTSIPSLQRVIEGDDARHRVHAGRTLLTLDPGHSVTIRAMIKDLRHSNPEVRRDAVLALELVRTQAAKEIVEPLAQALNDTDGFVREVAASKLNDIGPLARSVRPALINAMQDPAFEVRGYAALALGNIGQDSVMVIDVLTHGIDDEEGDVRILVVRALGNIGPAARSSIPKLRAVLLQPELHEGLRLSVEESLSKILKNK